MFSKAFRRTLAGGATAMALALSATSAAAETLTDALIAAYRTSGLLEQNRALLRATDEDVAQAVAALRPVLTWVATSRYAEPTQGDELTGSVGLNASLLLFDFGASRLNVDIQKETVLATRAALVSVEQQVLLRGVAAFLGVRRESAFVSLRENNLRLIQEQLRAAQDRFEVGEITRTDVSIAEARLASARSGLAAAQGSLTRAIAEYVTVTGRTPGQLQPPPPAPASAATLSDAIAIAMSREPSLEQRQREVTAAELAINSAAARLRPALNARAGVSVDEDGDDSSSLTLELSGPIYRGGQLTSQIRQQRARAEAARAVLLTTGQDVEQGVRNAWADLTVAGASLAASNEEVRAAQLALRGAREEFNVGARTTLDVLDLEQDLLDAQTNRVAAEIDRTQAVYGLLESMGLLTVDHLELGIPTYDPAAYYNAVEGAPTRDVSPQGERLDRVLRSLGRE